MKALTLLISLSLFLLYACTQSKQQSGADATQRKDEQTQKQAPKQVGVITIEKQSLSNGKSMPGRVEAFNVAQIRPQVSGIIESLFFKQGSLVEKGQQLYQIDAARYEVEYQSAQANLQNANAELQLAQTLVNRYQELKSTDAISDQELDNAFASQSEAESAVALAKAALQTAKINLDYTKVYAPISGYIGPSTVTQGALVTAQQTTALAVVRQLDPIYVDLSQSASSASTVSEDLLNTLRAEEQETKYEVSLFLGDDNQAYPDKGKLVATDLAVDESTSNIRMRTVFPNPDARLLPGMFVQGTIDKLEPQQVMIVPHKAVDINPDGTKTVWLVDQNNSAIKREVVISKSYENNWIIASGLKPGDRVIVEGTMMLRPGTRVAPQAIGFKLNGGVFQSDHQAGNTKPETTTQP